MGSNVLNESDFSSLNFSELDLPIDMRFNEGHVVSIVAYSILLTVSVIGNVTVLTNLISRRRSSNPRVTLMLIHLAVADLLVCSSYNLHLCSNLIY